MKEATENVRASEKEMRKGRPRILWLSGEEVYDQAI